MFAGLGVFWFLKNLTFTPNASFVGAIVFMSSPYVLAYQSRTSSILLPWAAIGWLCFFTLRGVKTKTWLWPSLIALTMFTVGAVNATATLLILPGPILVALFNLNKQPLREIIGFSTKTVFLTFGISLWWIVMLTIQSRYGAQLLSYSETLESVSSTSHAYEVLRGFGYWLNYVGLDSAPLTTGAQKVFESPIALAAGVALVVISIAALGLSHHPHRRLGLWLVIAGTTLGVGVYPLSDAVPIFSQLANNPTSSLSLAFRSSTRAIPILLLGLAIGVAIFCDGLAVRSLTTRAKNPRWLKIIPSRFIMLIVVVLAGLANSTRYTTGSFEPSLERSPIPQTWNSFAETVDDLSVAQSRVVQLPGQEFGNYSWGYTVDPALPAVSNTGLLTRDLIPLGNESMMNLLWATDEAAREGRLHANALSSLARIFSARTFFFPGDLNTEKYSTPAQSSVLQINNLTNDIKSLGNLADSHKYISFDSSIGSIIRQQPSSVLLLGDGKGVVDSAIGGLLKNETLIYAGHLTDSELANFAQKIQHVVVTDTNTERAQHWRTSIDTNGFDENREGDLVNFGKDSADIRMRIFSTQRSDDKTWFEQIGPVRARASSYGPPLLYRAEHRPFAAIDNDPTTSWQAANGANPIAPVIQLLSQDSLDVIRVLQPQGDINRRISKISVSVDDQEWVEHVLDASSLNQGQLIALASPANVVTIRIDETVETRALRPNEELSGVGFAEITTGLGATQEVGVLASRGLENISTSTPISYLMTRRIAPLERSTRSEIETRIIRSFFIPATRQMSITIRFDTTERNEEQINELIERNQAQPILQINKTPVSFTSLTRNNDGAVTGTVPFFLLADGEHLLETLDSNYPIDQILISDNFSVGEKETLLPTVTQSGVVNTKLQTQPCPQGCWLVFGEGHSQGWSAHLDGIDLGPSQVVDGGANGWWIEPTTKSHQVEIQFAPQQDLNIALLISALFILLCLGLIIFSRRSKPITDPWAPTKLISPTASKRNTAWAAGINAVAMVALFDLRTALWTSALLGFVAFIGKQKWLSLALVVVFTVAMFTTLWVSLVSDEVLDFGWTQITQGSNHLLLFSLVALGSLCLLGTKPTSPINNPIK